MNLTKNTGCQSEIEHRISEKRLTAKIIEELKKRGFWFVKLHGGPWQRAGLPDILVIVNGRAVWLEIKTRIGTLTRLQKATLDKLEKAGCQTFVVRSMDRFRQLFDGIPK